jgi:hypothetical protein
MPRVLDANLDDDDTLEDDEYGSDVDFDDPDDPEDPEDPDELDDVDFDEDEDED